MDSLRSAGLSENVAKFLSSAAQKEARFNNDPLSLGDKITIAEIDAELGEFDGSNFVNVRCTADSDRQVLSLGKLVGTPKRAKYFGADSATKHVLADGVTPSDANLLDLTQMTKGEAAVHVNTNLKGHTFEVVGIAYDCGYVGRTFVLWREVGKPKKNNKGKNNK